MAMNKIKSLWELISWESCGFIQRKIHKEILEMLNTQDCVFFTLSSVYDIVCMD